VGPAYIKKEFRCQGTGKLLMKELIKWFKKKKIKFVELSVNSRNKIGIAAWKRYGFFEFEKRMRLDL